MADERDEVLSLSPSEDEFSGFSEKELSYTVEKCATQLAKKEGKKGKSVKTKKTSSKGKMPLASSSHASSKTKANPVQSNIVDLDKLTPTAIESLRLALGINSGGNEVVETETEKVPRDNLVVEFDNDGFDPDYVIESGEAETNNKGPFFRSPLQALESNIDEALFGETQTSSMSNDKDELEWDLPQLKAPKLGDNIPSSLAKLISTSCTAQCMTDDIIDRYKIPSNCQEMGPPSVNAEIFHKLDKKGQLGDKSFKNIQNMVATAMMPVVKLSGLLKSEITVNKEARTCISDAVTLLGQVQYHLSLRRRYLIRPSLKKLYAGLCNFNTPITTQLFGDDISAEMKKCDTANRINNELYSSNRPNQRGFFRGRRGYGSNRRFHPYNRRGSYYSGRGGGRSSNNEIPTTQRSSSSVLGGDTSSSQDYGVGRIDYIRQYLQSKKVPEGAIEVVLRSWSRGTRKQYDLAWRKWELWCRIRETDPISASEEDVLAYLSFLCFLRKSYSVINTHKCMIVQTLLILGQKWCASPVLLARFMKGVFVKSPPKPRYSCTWDVAKVLNYLRSIDIKDNLKFLTFKTIALLALSTAARAQTLVSLKLSNMTLATGFISFVFTDFLKTSRSGRQFNLRVGHYGEEDLCPMHTVMKYIDRTSTVRKSDQLFVSFVTFRAVTTSTLARWLKEVLSNSGISTDRFKAHSFRSASVSAARRAGCSIHEILQTADWSSAKTFHGFYYREQEQTNIGFTQAVLNR